MREPRGGWIEPVGAGGLVLPGDRGPQVGDVCGGGDAGSGAGPRSHANIISCAAAANYPGAGREERCYRPDSGGSSRHENRELERSGSSRRTYYPQSEARDHGAALRSSYVTGRPSRPPDVGRL